MNKQELIERIEGLKNIFWDECEYVKIDFMIKLVSELDEPEVGHADEAPRYVKNILARLRELPLHDREVWLKTIMGEFEQDFSRAKWREGYEQGKVEGLIEHEKVTVPQFVADWIEYCQKHDFTLFGCLDPENGFESLVNETFEGDVRKCIRWCRKESNILARAWLYGHTVEEEKRYYVRFKGMESGDFNYLNFIKFQHAWVLSSIKLDKKFRTEHTKKQLEEAGFSWVFDCPGIEIEEVTE
jgi:phage protein